MIDYEAAFKKPFTDIGKLIIGILLSILPVLQWFAFGFILECSGVGKTKDSEEMPLWTNWGHLFVNGLLAWIITVIYMIPAIIVLLVGAGTVILGLISVIMGMVPPEIMTGLMANDPNAQLAFADIIKNNWFALLPWLLTFLPFLLIAGLLALLASYLLPIGILNFIKHRKFGEAFNFQVVFKKVLTPDYFTVWLVVFAVTVLVSFFLGFIPVVGRAISYFILGVFAYTVFGQVYKMK